MICTTSAPLSAASRRGKTEVSAVAIREAPDRPGLTDRVDAGREVV